MREEKKASGFHALDLMYIMFIRESTAITFI
jgi:hypothetical protein